MSEEKEKRNYGAYLQSVRLKKGISIEDVSAQTRIRPGVLKRIEAENESQLPDPVFVKGFIKSVADAIGADPDEAIRRYRAAKPAESPAVVPPPVEKTAKPVSVGTLLLAIVVIVALVAAATGFEHWLSGTGGDTGDAHTEPLVSETRTPSESPQDPPEVAIPPKSQTADPKPSAPTELPPKPASEPVVTEEQKNDPPKLLLRVAADEETWLKVIRDNEKPDEYFLKPGDQLELEAHSVYNLLIGNAGGLQLELNGEPVQLAGRSGQVMTLQLP